MIFGEEPSFIELIEDMKVLEDRFHSKFAEECDAVA